MKNNLSTIILLLVTTTLIAQSSPGWQGKFEQLEQILPTPNEYRTGSGAPGPDYWQQQADYMITAELNDQNQMLTGYETITYSNQSPNTLNYLWLQLDQNLLSPDNDTDKTRVNAIDESMIAKTLANSLALFPLDGGFKISSIKDASGQALPYTINKTMMRVDLPKPLASGESLSFSIDWSFMVTDRMNTGQRSGYEFFPQDGNYLYTIAQWFPRMCVYDDVVGWQNKQFLGQGEFALPFGNYKVSITVPADHLVAATGTLQNANDVLTADQLTRFELAKTSFDTPVIIATQQEAVEREKTKSTQKKTWVFEAENVRDFAFVSSRKFIWDAMAVRIGDNTPMAMSFYPKEGNPLWERESTRAVKNALTTYSSYSIDYPYPVAISVHTASIGMEYPMICFNYGRPEENGQYSDQTKWRMIGVVIHEVGHNFFPMIVNSDERQWTWMDEGLNSFLQYRTETENYPGLPSRRGPVSTIMPYLRGSQSIQRPVMTNSEQIIQFGNEQYAKCATALNVLRETVMGSELFDAAFKEYSRRWAFKHPQPADFFRTMEDASAVDLDWFWRGWFYTTDVNDQSIEKVTWYRTRKEPTNLEGRNATVRSGNVTGNSSNSTNFDNGPTPFTILPTDPRFYGEFRNQVDDQAIMNQMQNKNFYEVTIANQGGLVMPVIVEWTYADGSREIEKLPAEIWRSDEQKITKVFVKDKEVKNIVIDPNGETADVNNTNNIFPKVETPSKFDELRNGN